MQDSTQPRDDTNAMANIRYTLDSLAELDYECGTRSGVGLFPYRVRDGVYGVECKLTTAIGDDKAGVELVDSSTYAEAVTLAVVAEILAEGIEYQFKAVRARVDLLARTALQKAAGT